MRCSKTDKAWFRSYGVGLCTMLVWFFGLTAPIKLSAETIPFQSVAATRGVPMKPQIVQLQWSSTMPKLKSERRTQLEKASHLINRPRPPQPRDGVMGVGPTVPPTPAALPSVGIQAPEDFRSSIHLFTDAETNNATSVINEPSVGQLGEIIFVTANWFAARSTDFGASFTFVDPDIALPSISGQFFCCDQSIIYDRSRNRFIWVSLWVNPTLTTGTIRIAVSEDATTWAVYDFSSADFGLSGLPDYPHISLGANSLYMTMNHFDPFFTKTTVFACGCQ